MRKLLAVAVLSLMVCCSMPPISAQNLNIFNPNNNFGKNPVSYASLEAFSENRGVWLQWKTEVETKNLGFYVYRISGGERELISPALIPGAYLQSREEKITAGSYSTFDRLGDLNSTYVIESYNLNGRRYDSETIQTQFIQDLATITGISSEELENQARNAAPVTLEEKSLLPKDLAAEVALTTARVNPTTQLWVAAQPGVKIFVKKEGLYRVAAAVLLANGFDTTAPRNLWQLYVGGVEQSINIAADGSYIEFYGKPIETLDADAQTYFLVVGTQNGKRIGSTLRRRIGGSVTSESYLYSSSKKERFNYSQNYLNGDTENFFGTVASSDPVNIGTISFNLTGVDFNAVNAGFGITIQGLTQVAHQTVVTLNTVELGTLTSVNYGSASRHFNIPTSALREGINEVKIKTLASTDITLFGGLTVSLSRRYKAEQNQISFYVPNYKANYVENFSSPNIRVFDTTDSDNPLLITGLLIEPSGGSNRVYLPSNRGRVMFAVEDSAIMQPFSVVRNTPSTLSTTNNNGEMIIISHKDWLAQAEDWAVYRRAQGLTVKVVNIEDVFDEFSYGVLKPDAIRDFLRYAKENWLIKPNYVLLLGDATYDPKNHLGAGNINFVPTRLIDTIYTETGSDETLADFNDDGLAEIAIGRIPARNGATVTLALNKMIAFEQTVGQALNRGVIFASDLPNGYDFEGVSIRLRDQLPANIPRIMINRALPDANAQLVSQINTGRFLVNYTGHGSATFWAATDFFSSSHANILTNTDRLSIFTMLTCLNGYFIQSTDSLSEVLLKNPNGGAVATWASSGLTTPDIQEIMATRFYNQIAVGNITRIGDMIKDAKTTINFGRDVRLSWVLLGDPAMKIK